MIRLQSYIQRILLLTVLCLVVVTAVLYVVSASLSRMSYAMLSRDELTRSVQAGARLLRAYTAGDMDIPALRAAVNPAVNPGDIFLILLDTRGEALAYTENAAPYAAALDLNALTAGLDESETFFSGAVEASDMFLMGLRTDHGVALSGKPMLAYDSASRDFRAKLLQYMLPLTLTLAALSVYLSSRLAKPASIIVDAAKRMSEGEIVRVPEKLPFEMGDIGRAFNHMSARLSRSLGEVTYERDTITLVLDGLLEGVIAVDEAGDLLHENGAALQLLGGRASAQYAQVLQRLRQAVDADVPALRLIRGEQALLAVFGALPERAGLRRGAVAMVRDITRQERLERTRYDYVANISHELRTPLASMRGMAEALRDGLVTGQGEQARYAGMIVEEVKRLSRLVNDLLELSSLQSNPAAFEMESVDPPETLRELMDRSARLFSDKGVALLLDVPPDGLPPVKTNEDRLQQVLTILLDNALKFTPAGGTVTLGARAEGRLVRFFVRDDGIGMDEHTARHAFERFHQADPGRAGKGSGLGLSIAREILQKMNVKIHLESEKGKGSTISFALPRQG